MVKFKKAALVAALIILGTAFAHANSGPTYWSADPSMETLTIDKDSPIKILKEELVFDFSDEFIDRGHNSISGLVTANYKMNNPTDEKLLVQMAFPFAANLWSFDPSEIDILADGTDVPFQIYIGDSIKSKEKNDNEDKEQSLTFDTIVSYVKKDKYIPKHYDLKEMGTLIRIDAFSNEGENAKLAVEYAIDHTKTKVIGKGFHGYEGTDNSVKLSSWINSVEYLELFVIGDDIELSIQGYADGEMNEATDKLTYKVDESKISIEDYMEMKSDEHEEQLHFSDRIAEYQMFNLYAKSFDEMIGKNAVNYWIDEWASVDYENKVLVLLYELDFQPHTTVDTSVSYFAAGTMDKTETVDPLYTFEYLLNPAKNWADFNDLFIVIKPPAEHPFIIDSTIDLVRNDEGFYIANLDGLPDNDLSFTLYSNEKVTFLDKLENQFNRSLYFLPILIPIVIPILIIGIVLIFKRGRSKKY